MSCREEDLRRMRDATDGPSFEVSAKMRRLEEVVDSLHVTLEQIEKRLDVVLLIMPVIKIEQVLDTQPDSAVSPLGQRIQGVTAGVASATQFLAEITRRLAV